MTSAESPDPEAPIRLRSGRQLAFHGTGLRHPALAGERFTAYRSVLHQAVSPAGWRISTDRSAYWIRRRDFRSSEEMIGAAQALRERIAAQPEGEVQLARMALLDEKLRRSPEPVLGRVLAWTCWILFALTLFAGPFEVAAVFMAPWVEVGEWWRVVTSQFLHGGPIHLVLNTLCIWVLAGLLERSIGRGRAVAVLTAAGIGSGLACLWAQYEWAVGISGIVFGVIGALLVLEFRFPDTLPANWRLPRALFVGVLVADLVLLAGFDSIAHAAHFGGLVAGGLACLAVAPRDASPLREAMPWRPLPALVAVAVALTFVPPLRAWIDPDGSFELRAERLLQMDDVPPAALNNPAWELAISRAPTEGQLALALRLAERAVALTGRGDANLLDTLAEVHFARGDTEQAIATIDEAIALSSDRYFREQRRRYTGERAPDDRPAAPRIPRPGAPATPVEPDLPRDAIRV